MPLIKIDKVNEWTIEFIAHYANETLSLASYWCDGFDFRASIAMVIIISLARKLADVFITDVGYLDWLYVIVGHGY